MRAALVGVAAAGIALATAVPAHADLANDQAHYTDACHHLNTPIPMSCDDAFISDLNNAHFTFDRSKSQLGVRSGICNYYERALPDYATADAVAHSHTDQAVWADIMRDNPGLSLGGAMTMMSAAVSNTCPWTIYGNPLGYH